MGSILTKQQTYVKLDNSVYAELYDSARHYDYIGDYKNMEMSYNAIIYAKPKEMDNLYKKYKILSLIDMALYFKDMNKKSDCIYFLTLAVHMKSADAANYLGCYYYELENYTDAKIYLMKAAKQDHVKGMTNLGHYYRLVENNIEEMGKWYKYASNLGYSPAMYELGCYYQKKKDYGLMKNNYEMAIQKNHTGAMNNLAHHYETVEKQINLAMIYYNRAISLGSVEAATNLGNYFYKKKDFEAMKKMYMIAMANSKSTSIGLKNAMSSLASYYKYDENNIDMFIKCQNNVMEQDKEIAVLNTKYISSY